jgi:hypothetical protein
MPMSDIEESPVQRFNASSITGDVLPVTAFKLDDVAFIVKESDHFPKFGRTITIPAHALLIKDGSNIAGAEGRLDSPRATVYVYQGQQRSISPSSQSLSTALNTIAGMGITPIPHNHIRISDMRSRGFVDGSGNVAFKVIHVSHGYGFLNMMYKLDPCH